MSNDLMQMAQSKLVRDVHSYRELGNTDEQIALKMSQPLAVIQSVPLPRPCPSRQRSIQHQQLQKMAAALMPAVEEKNPQAINLMLKVQRREADLLGLDAPKEVITQNFNQNVPKDARELTTAELEALVRNSIQGESTRVED